MEKIQAIHSSNLELIAAFDDFPLNDVDFTLAKHPAHDYTSLEKLNVLNDLVSQIQESDSHESLNSLIVTGSQEKNN